MNNTMINSLVGMQAMQQKIDSISNNVANASTTGYKSRDTYFGELLTSRLEQPEQLNQLTGRTSPKGLDMGYGSKMNLTLGNFTQGPQQETGLATDLMLAGENIFFTLAPSSSYDDGQLRFTRDGNFKLDANGNLVNSSGYYVLSTDGEPITIPENAKFTVDNQGRIIVEYNDGNKEEIGALDIKQINNPQVLERIGENQFRIPEEFRADQFNVINGDFNLADDTTGLYRVVQGSLEGSNIDMGKEMVQLNEAQRAYQLLSRSLSISDQMMGIANNLRG